MPIVVTSRSIKAKLSFYMNKFQVINSRILRETENRVDSVFDDTFNITGGFVLVTLNNVLQYK